NTYMSVYYLLKIFTVASITKLFTTACMLILREQDKLALDDEVTIYFVGEPLSGLHVYKGEECSSKITIAHLLFQTSGLPDVPEEGDCYNERRKSCNYRWHNRNCCID